MVAINLKEKLKNGELDLSSCGLKEIPKEINNLKHVTSLNLSNNKITSVGKILGHLTHLHKLDLSKNQIKGLPENIGSLVNLKHLNLSYNQISTLPATLGQLKNLKHFDLKNNNLAQKFSEIVGPCHNELQCQQAAKNLLKAFSPQSDTDKKKKQTDQNPKKKKTEKIKQQNGIGQKQPKDRKQKPKGIFGRIFGALFSFFKSILLLTLMFSIMIYILSFYDEGRYSALKKKFYPVWRSALTRVCDEDSANKLEVILVQYGNTVNKSIVTGTKLLVTKYKQFHTYVTTDETIQGYVNSTKTVVQEYWLKLRSMATGDQKQKS